jgi:hypothetical protein
MGRPRPRGDAWPLWAALTLCAALRAPAQPAADPALADSASSPPRDTLRVDRLTTPSDAGGLAADSLAVSQPSPATAPAVRAARDTSRLRVEFGARSDLTNESYYEEAFVDTTFLGRRLVDTPEHRSAAVISAVLAGTRGDRAAQYRLQGDAVVGNLLQRGSLWLAWRGAPGLSWAWSLDPRVEYRRDRTLGRDLEEWRARVGARLRRAFGDDFTHAELGARGDLLRTGGVDIFLLDRQTGSLALALDHFGLVGDEWRLAYRLAGRVFPDSSERDHLEHVWEGRRKVVWDGRWLSLDATGTRRVTVDEVASSRDNFWNGAATLEARAEIAGPWSLGARAEGELTRYDLEDSTLFFDYEVVRGQLGLRHERGVRWSVAAGPRFETLMARLNPGERYREFGGVLEIEFLGTGSWWSVTPAAGWRDYDRVPAAGAGTPALHSSFAYYEIGGIADQTLAGALRLRALVAVRWERHLDPTQDARSLLVSSELLWAFR